MDHVRIRFRRRRSRRGLLPFGVADVQQIQRGNLMNIPSASSQSPYYSMVRPSRSEQPLVTNSEDKQRAPAALDGGGISQASNSSVSPDYLAIDTFAALLSAQGKSVVAPNMALELTLDQSTDNGSRSSSTVRSTRTGEAGPWLTAADIANRIAKSIGSDGQISLHDAEKAFTAPNPGKQTNSYATIAEDFKKLAGDDGQLSVPELTSAIQQYMDAHSSGGSRQGKTRTVIV